MKREHPATSDQLFLFQQRPNKQELLRNTSFGQRIAEDEADALQEYFVRTVEWAKLVDGDVDIIYGPKGSGKSALYSLLVRQADGLRKRGIRLIAAENPKGTPAFKGLVTDPPSSEDEFKVMWKLYFLSLVSNVMATEAVSAPAAEIVLDALKQMKIVPPGSAFESLLKSIVDTVRRLSSPSSIEGSISLDSSTGMINGLRAKITPGVADATPPKSVDELLKLADSALVSQGLAVWIVLDRLDVAFEQSPDLEENALRSLFRVYLDLQQLMAVKPKIFLRTDIWDRITNGGFREASHITRTATICWDENNLLNLVVRRALQNESVRRFYGVKNSEEILASFEAQKAFTQRLWPLQVVPGKNRPETFKWLLTRTADGSGLNAPRELIHLLNEAVSCEMKRAQLGQQDQLDEHLVSGPALRSALPEVSRVRLDTVVYSEYPDTRPYIQKLRGRKAEYNLMALAAIWGGSRAETLPIAERLTKVGFFERKGSEELALYSVPFLYRDALELTQGKEIR